jgi:hypothetical protein
MDKFFASLVWTEFQTRFQVLGPSLKLGPKFFFLRLCVFEKLRLSLKLGPVSLDRVLNSVPTSC